MPPYVFRLVPERAGRFRRYWEPSAHTARGKGVRHLASSIRQGPSFRGQLFLPILWAKKYILGTLPSIKHKGGSGQES